jgi:type VI secretion system protein ImpH
MAGETGAEAPRLNEVEAALRDEPWRFDFFQAVRRIEAARARCPRIGTSARPADDPVRFGQLPSLAFAPSTVAQYVPASDGRAPRLLGLFFGLLGPNGPLPLHLTDYAHERISRWRDPTLVRFLDVFHHRMLSFFYRAWAISRPTASCDRPASDWFAGYLGSLCGYGLAGLRNRDAMPDRARLYYAGLLALQTHHPYGLRALLTDFFGLPFAVREFVGEWVRLPQQACCRLGASAESGTLGLSGLLGLCIWSVQHRFRLILGPVSLTDFRRFLPGSPRLQRLVAFVRTYVGDELAWDLNLVLKREEVPQLALGGGQLGWTTWLPSARADRDPDDLVLEPLRGG